MKFTDFKPEELIGKLVLYESGSSYGGTTKSIYTIVNVTKTAFKIGREPHPPLDALFSLTDGYQKGLRGRQNMGIISHCELITEEQAAKLRKE